MNKRSLRNGAIVVITLGALTGVGTMVASASTRTNDAAAPAGNSAAQRGDDAAAPDNNNDPNDNANDPNNDPNDNNDDDATRPFDPDASPSPFDPNVSPSPVDPDQAAANANANSCVAVQVINVQANDGAQLCTTVQGNRVQVRLTAPGGECQGTVTLQLTTAQGAPQTDTVPCAGNDSATATFTADQQVADGSQICGVLAADQRFATARACVRAAA